MVYVPDLAFTLFSLMATHIRGVNFALDDKYMSVTLVDGRLRFWSDGSGYLNYGRRIDPDDHYIPFTLLVPDLIENPVQPALPVTLGFPVIAPGGDDSHENEWLNSLTFLPENLVQSAPPCSPGVPCHSPR